MVTTKDSYNKLRVCKSVEQQLSKWINIYRLWINNGAKSTVASISTNLYEIF